MVDPAAMQSVRLTFDPLDSENLDHLGALIEGTSEFRSLGHSIPAIRLADAVLTARSLESLGGVGSGFELAFNCVGSKVPRQVLRSIFGLLPDPAEQMEVSIPRSVEAREVTQGLASLAGGTTDSARLLRYDMAHAKSRFFLLAYDFGVQPAREQKVNYARFKSILTPARMARDSFLRTYSIAPQSSWQHLGSRTFNLTVNGDLGMELRDPVGGALKAAAGAAANYVYQTQYTLATATVVGATNGNEVTSWAMKPGPEDGQDPRGWFRMYATLGVPQVFGKTIDELNQRIKARLNAKVRTNWTLSQPRDFAKAASVPVQFVCPQ